jgi:membrane-associated protease RseP (regulator of RpoE activity)
MNKSSLFSFYTLVMLVLFFSTTTWAENSEQFGGLGISIQASQQGIMVVNVIENTPAANAGIQAGDIIVSVNNKPVQGLSLDEGKSLLRGVAGTQVHLGFVRGNGELFITLTRAHFQINTVSSKEISQHYKAEQSISLHRDDIVSMQDFSTTSNVRFADLLLNGASVQSDMVQVQATQNQYFSAVYLHNPTIEHKKPIRQSNPVQDHITLDDTFLGVTLPQKGPASLDLITAEGKVVSSFSMQSENAGLQRIAWDSSTLSAGQYFLVLKQGAFSYRQPLRIQ